MQRSCQLGKCWFCWAYGGQVVAALAATTAHTGDRACQGPRTWNENFPGPGTFDPGMKFFILLLSLAPALAEAGPFLDHQRRYARVRAAALAHADLPGSFRDAGAAWPPRIFLRGFKAEGTLELWAAPAKRGRAWVHVQDFPICAASGDLGPKLRQGDGQVPEGVYAVDRFNPISAYHLSLGLSYPNAYDRARTRAQVGREADPGDNIFVHGSCVTVGCLPLRDAPMERLYLASIAARDAGQRRIPVHVFPCHLDSVACHLRLANAVIEEPALGDFWAGLLPAFQAFENVHVPPRIRVRRDGYHLQPRAGS